MIGEMRSATSADWRYRSGWSWRGAAVDRTCARMISTSVGVEARRGQRKPQVLERFVAILRQRAQRAAQGVALRLEAQLDRLALEAIVKRLSKSNSPAPSSSRDATRFAVPPLPAGSCAAPPTKAKSTAISGTAGSRTSQASMPPGTDHAFDSGRERRCGETSKRHDGKSRDG